MLVGIEMNSKLEFSLVYTFIRYDSQKRIFTLYYLWNQSEMNWSGTRAPNKRDGER